MPKDKDLVTSSFYFNYYSPYPFLFFLHTSLLLSLHFTLLFLFPFLLSAPSPLHILLFSLFTPLPFYLSYFNLIIPPSSSYFFSSLNLIILPSSALLTLHFLPTLSASSRYTCFSGFQKEPFFILEQV